MTISKRLRFEILRRDNHMCRAYQIAESLTQEEISDAS